MEAWAVVAAIAATASAIGTFVQALVARGQLKEISQQVAQAEEGVEAARRSAEAATATLRESIRTRVSETAPRVTVLMEAPEWPPYLDATRPHVSGGEPMPLAVPGQSQQIDPSREFVESRDDQALLWFKTYGVVVNEGKGTARVRLNPHARFIQGFVLGYEVRQLPAPVGAAGSGEYRLGPGEVALFEWGNGKPVEQWRNTKEKSVCFLQVTVWSFDSSVVDYTYVELRGQPLERGQRPYSWYLSKTSGSVGTFVYPTQRTFAEETTLPPKAPWNQPDAAKWE